MPFFNERIRRFEKEQVNSEGTYFNDLKQNNKVTKENQNKIKHHKCSCKQKLWQIMSKTKYLYVIPGNLTWRYQPLQIIENNKRIFDVLAMKVFESIVSVIQA